VSDLDSVGGAEAVDPPGPIVEPYIPFPAFAEWLTAPFDGSLIDQFARELDRDREELSSASLNDAVEIATKWAAVNTGAIEGLYEVDRGFTYSVAVSAAAWSDIHLLKGSKAAASMQDAVNAYDFVLDATTKAHPITEVWIRELHAMVCASQETYTVITAVGPQEQALPKGEYKSQPNSPLNLASNIVHSYAPPLDTPSEMARMVDELRSGAFENAHPVLQAAYAHYAFVCIHPFADGNGRVSRALASMFLYRSPGVPLVIFADQKAAYLDTLEAADRGAPERFVRFINERVIDTVGMVRAQMDGARVPDVQTQLAELAPLLSGKDGLPHTEIDAIAIRLLDVVADAFRSQIEANPLSSPLSAAVQRGQTGQPAGMPNGYRSLPQQPPNVIVTVTSNQPANGSENRQYSVGVSRPGVEGPDFVVYWSSRVLLEVYLREMHPTVSQALVFRAEAQALREYREILSGVAVQATQSLRNQGYVE
jgi:Fic family protein